MTVAAPKTLFTLTAIAMMFQLSACSTHQVKNNSMSASDADEESLFVDRVLATGGEGEAVEVVMNYLRLLPEAEQKATLAEMNKELSTTYRLSEVVTDKTTTSKLTDVEANTLLKNWKSNSAEIYGSKSYADLQARSDAEIKQAQLNSYNVAQKTAAINAQAAHLGVQADGIKVLGDIRTAKLAAPGDTEAASYMTRIGKAFVKAYRNGMAFIGKDACEMSTYDGQAAGNIAGMGEAIASSTDAAKSELGTGASQEKIHSCAINKAVYRLGQWAKNMGYNTIEGGQKLFNNILDHCELGNAEINAAYQRYNESSFPQTEPSCS
jgi:hypothetical protein